jgi:cell division protein FtsB
MEATQHAQVPEDKMEALQHAQVPEDKMEALQQALQQMQKRLDRLEKENAELRKENAQLRAENAQLRAENAQLRAENAQLREENAALKRDMAAVLRVAEQAVFEAIRVLKDGQLWYAVPRDVRATMLAVRAWRCSDAALLSAPSFLQGHPSHRGQGDASHGARAPAMVHACGRHPDSDWVYSDAAPGDTDADRLDPLGEDDWRAVTRSSTRLRDGILTLYMTVGMRAVAS